MRCDLVFSALAAGDPLPTGGDRHLTECPRCAGAARLVGLFPENRAAPAVGEIIVDRMVFVRRQRNVVVRTVALSLAAATMLAWIVRPVAVVPYAGAPFMDDLVPVVHVLAAGEPTFGDLATELPDLSDPTDILESALLGEGNL